MVDEQRTRFDVVVVAHAVNGDTDPGHEPSRGRTKSGAPCTEPVPGVLAGPGVLASRRAPGSRCALYDSQSVPAPYRKRSAGGFVMDPPVEGGEALPAAAPARGDDLRGDAHRGLLGGTRAEVQPDRRGQPGQLGPGEPGLAQPGQPVLMGTAGAHRAHVGDR